MRNLFINNRFYFTLVIIILVFIISFSFTSLFFIAQILFFGFLVLCIFEVFMLYSKEGIIASRIAPEKLSNGDENPFRIEMENRYTFSTSLNNIDELPIQFQRRDTNWKASLKSKEKNEINYTIRPTKRGEYDFGAVNIFATSPIGLISRRFVIDQGIVLPVYPSFLQMKKYEFAAFTQNLKDLGIKKVKRLGHTMEFEQIKEYVQGDDARTINWKATARRNGLMVNQFQDQRSQQIYCVIDKGRQMRMPFDGLSLLDYSINASLVMANIAIKKQDKAGLLTFSNKMSSMLKAEKTNRQMFKMQELLFNQKTYYLESNFELLNSFVHRKINQRSLLLLFTNFESIFSMRRQLKYFKNLAKRHVVVVIFFHNTELDILVNSSPQAMEEIYQQAIAENTVFEKELIVKELKRNGVHSILTKPQDLTVNTINKYLELKARGLI